MKILLIAAIATLALSTCFQKAEAQNYPQEVSHPSAAGTYSLTSRDTVFGKTGDSVYYMYFNNPTPPSSNYLSNRSYIGVTTKITKIDSVKTMVITWEGSNNPTRDGWANIAPLDSVEDFADGTASYFYTLPTPKTAFVRKKIRLNGPQKFTIKSDFVAP